MMRDTDPTENQLNLFRICGSVKARTSTIIHKIYTRKTSTSHANDFLNAKNHARERPLLGGYNQLEEHERD